MMITARFLELQWNILEKKISPFYHRMRHEGYLRHLLVRKAVKTEELIISITIHTRMDGRRKQCG